MNEASKTNSLRGQAFFDRYLGGKVIDIGCGTDLVVPHAEPFDLVHGDANNIASYRPEESYDCVHSSHCLEHMRDVPHALRQWYSLVKPGGFMIVVVPEENLYEQGIWPSIFNSDHKATFRLDRPTSWSPVSYDIRELASTLPDAEVINAELQDRGYDYHWITSTPSRFWKLVWWSSRLRKRAFRILGLPPALFSAFFSKMEFHLGLPIDQTAGDAMAQIQLIVRKRVRS